MNAVDATSLCPITWAEFVNNLPPMGMAGMLAKHCEFGWCDFKGHIYLSIDLEHAHLATTRFADRLLTNLRPFFTPKIEITITVKVGKASGGQILSAAPIPDTWAPEDARAVYEINTDPAKYRH